MLVGGKREGKKVGETKKMKKEVQVQEQAKGRHGKVKRPSIISKGEMQQKSNKEVRGSRYGHRKVKEINCGWGKPSNDKQGQTKGVSSASRTCDPVWVSHETLCKLGSD